MPAGWFQSLGALLVIAMAPLFAGIWSALARRNLNPSQPVKLALGLMAVGLGYVFMVWGSIGTTTDVKASMFFLSATFFWHTVGELCMSPTGLAFLNRVAPVKSVSLLMGIWFLSNAVANKVGGQIAGSIERLEKGEIVLPWSHWFTQGQQTDFYLFFVFISCGAGLVVFALAPLLKWLIKGRTEEMNRKVDPYGNE
jgi:POT family proton-dependent oligopeptide transporter